MTSKSVKFVSLLLLAGLASGTVYARGGGGAMGGMGGERDQIRTQERTQQRVRADDGAHSAEIQRHQNRYEFSKENLHRGVSRAGQ